MLTHALHYTVDPFTQVPPRVTLLDPSDMLGSALRDATDLTSYFVLTDDPTDHTPREPGSASRHYIHGVVIGMTFLAVTDPERHILMTQALGTDGGRSRNLHPLTHLIEVNGVTLPFTALDVRHPTPLHLRSGHGELHDAARAGGVPGVR